MKHAIISFVLFLYCSSSVYTQCGSTACPPGSVNILPANHIIAAGTVYCIPGPVNDASAYTINGTLIIQSGTVTLGNLTVGKTGAVIISPGAHFVGGSYTGETTAPAAVISNVTVCPSGHLYLSGAVNPGETNFTVSDYGAFVIHGSWSTIISDTYFKMGQGAVVEMCNPFMFKSSTGFFTETSTGPSYVVTRGAMANGAGAGNLSTAGTNSLINWYIPGGPVAWVTHPPANTCVGAACTILLPPGSIDNGVCGSVATGYPFTVLPIGFLNVEKKQIGQQRLIIAELAASWKFERLLLESSADGINFVATEIVPFSLTGNRYQFNLPFNDLRKFYRIQAVRTGPTVYSNVLNFPANSRTGGSKLPHAFPNPANNFIDLYIDKNENRSTAIVMDGIGNMIKTFIVPAGQTVIHCELRAGMAAGIYTVRIAGSSGKQQVIRFIKSGQ